MASKQAAVLTGDIVYYTKLKPAAARKLLQSLGEAFGKNRFEFYRGDSFQVLTEDPLEALRLALRCRSLAISMSARKEALHNDVRISIGIGKVPASISTLGAASGEAFLLSGRAFDTMTKENKRLSIAVTDPLAAAGLAAVADFADSVFRNLTIRQAALFRLLLEGRTQQEAAIELGKSKSTVHQHATSGNWNDTERILYHYTAIIQQIL